MSTYFIGDIHGCYSQLRTTLDHIHFDPNIDNLYLTGDLVSRGPNSLEVLRFVYSLGKKVRSVLGNHDLYLLQEYLYLKKNIDYKKNPHNCCFHSILQSPDVEELMYWLRFQPLLHIDKDRKILMSHAGIHPHWNINNAFKFAQEIEKILTSKTPEIIFIDIHTNSCNYISKKKLQQIQKNVNIFTRMRYLYPDGQLNMQYKNAPNINTPKNISPWFSFPRSINPDYNIIFGHWAALENDTKSSITGIYGLDSGCCWGKKLTTLKWEDKTTTHISCM